MAVFFIILLSQTKPIILTISIITKYRILVFFPHPLFFSSYKRFSEGKKGVSFLILPIERLTQESAPICKNRHEKKLLHTDKSHAGSCRQMRIKFNCKSMDNSTEKHHIFIFFDAFGIISNKIVPIYQYFLVILQNNKGKKVFQQTKYHILWI